MKFDSPQTGDAHTRGATSSEGKRPLNTSAVTDLVAVCAGVFGLALFAGLILVPAWGSYARLWQRLTATVLSLYVLVVLVGIGVTGALLIVYFWG